MPSSNTRCQGGAGAPRDSIKRFHAQSSTTTAIRSKRTWRGIASHDIVPVLARSRSLTSTCGWIDCLPHSLEYPLTHQLQLLLHPAHKPLRYRRHSVSCVVVVVVGAPTHEFVLWNGVVYYLPIGCASAIPSNNTTTTPLVE
mgnify:FL=1